MTTATYDPSVYDVRNLQDARQIILTNEDNLSSAQRWEMETPFLLDVFARQHTFSKDSVVLDYGCGVGRLAKGLIERYGCTVIGADISANMRGLAASYVNSARFVAVAPEALHLFGKNWADCTLCVWVLQHCFKPKIDLDYIDAALGFGQDLFVVNEKGRRVPTKEIGWCEDSLDIRKMLAERFDVRLAPGRLDPEVMTTASSSRTFHATYRKRGYL